MAEMIEGAPMDYSGGFMILIGDLKKSFSFRYRHAIRNNWLCTARMAKLKPNERLPLEQLGLIQEELLRSTLESARRSKL